MAKFKPDYNANQDNSLSALKPSHSDLSVDLRSEYPEIQNIREDISTLRDDVVSLTKHVKSNSSRHVEDVKHFAGDQLVKIREIGTDTIHKFEKRAAEKPGQTIALAFFAGLAASFLLGRKR